VHGDAFVGEFTDKGDNAAADRVPSVPHCWRDRAAAAGDLILQICDGGIAIAGVHVEGAAAVDVGGGVGVAGGAGALLEGFGEGIEV